MNNLRRMLLFCNHYSNQENKPYGPILLYKDKVGYYLDLNLSLNDKNFNFRLYDGFVNNVILMNKKIIDYILLNGARKNHCYNFKHESGGLVIIAPMCEEEVNGDISKMIEGIHGWIQYFLGEKY